MTGIDERRTALYQCQTSSGSTFQVLVEVLEERENYGRRDFLVTPVAGEGQVWIQAQSLVFSAPESGEEEEE